MRVFLVLIFLVLVPAISLSAGEYNPEADANAQIDQAVALASKQDKHVLIQVGGNWCPWCMKLLKTFHEDSAIQETLKANYVFIKVNYSKENKNLEVLKTLGNPQRFGFPVLVVLDAKGQRLHTQNTVYLEEGKGYNSKRVLGFLKDWTHAAVRLEK